jgi:hypothetical protein
MCYKMSLDIPGREHGKGKLSLHQALVREASLCLWGTGIGPALLKATWQVQRLMGLEQRWGGVNDGSLADAGQSMGQGPPFSCHLPVIPDDIVVIVSLRVIYRLVSGNSIEEKLLKNGTKDLIREVAAQGNDYSMAFLTQVFILNSMAFLSSG